MQSFSGQFTIIDTPDFTIEPVIQVLQGEVAGVVFRGYSSPLECASLLDRFLSDEHTRRREGDARGQYLGTFHWGKDQEEYHGDVANMREPLEMVIDSPEAKSWRSFIWELERGLQDNGVNLRRAKWGELNALSPLIRAWDGAGEFSLVPHDDLAQCYDPRQSAFEAQGVSSYAACSINLCIANEGGGSLVIWDCVPSEEDRRQLGTQFTGGPYQADLLNRYPMLEVEVAVGDLWVFNGGLIHAVRSATGRRATVSTLLGFCDERTVVLWT